MIKKLDGVGPMDNRPSINKIYNFVKKERKIKWHLTPDTGHVVVGEHSLKVSSLALMVIDLWHFEEWMNKWMNK